MASDSNFDTVNLEISATEVQAKLWSLLERPRSQIYASHEHLEITVDVPVLGTGISESEQIAVWLDISSKCSRSRETG